MTSCFRRLPTPWSGATVATAKCRKPFIVFAPTSTFTTASLWICSVMRRRKVAEKRSRDSIKRGPGKTVSNGAKDSDFVGFLGASHLAQRQAIVAGPDAHRMQRSQTMGAIMAPPRRLAVHGKHRLVHAGRRGRLRSQGLQ